MDDRRPPIIGRGRGVLARPATFPESKESSSSGSPSIQSSNVSSATPSTTPSASSMTSSSSSSGGVSSVVPILTIGRGQTVLGGKLRSAARPPGSVNAPIIIVAAASDIAPSFPIKSAPSTLGKGRGLLLKAASKPSLPPSVMIAQSKSPPPSEVSVTTRLSNLTIASDATAKAFSEIKETPPVVRIGTKGQTFETAVNYICLAVREGGGVFEYEVKFNPPVDSKGICYNLFKQQEAILGKTKTFDGSCLYLPFKLSDSVTTFTSKHPSTQTDVELKVIFKRTRRMSEVRHLYNVLFKRIMGELELIRFGRQHFDPKSCQRIPQHKLEVWPGFVTAVDEFEGGLFLHIDSSHRVLRTETVLDFIKSVATARNSDYKKSIMEALVGKSVITRYNNNLYKVDDVSFTDTPLSKFTKGNGEEISYVQYYKDQYGIDIMDINQPVLMHRSKIYVSGSDKPVERHLMLIPELCNMTGLSDDMTNNFTLMKDVAQYTRITPTQRIYALKKFVENVKACEPARRMLADWGLRLHDEPLRLPGRVLEPQKISFGCGDRGMPKMVSAGPKADWGRDSTSSAVVTPIDINNWALLFTSKDTNRANDLIETLLRCGPPMGIRIAGPRTVRVGSDRTTEWASNLKSIITDGLQLVVCLFPSRRDDIYSIVKKICCVEKPIPSQVINSFTLGNPKKLRAIVQKIALQINCKLGGVLWSVPLPFKNPIMVCGIDSYHDAMNKSRSVCAFVASYDMNLTRWYSRVAFQDKGQELVDCLKVCFGHALAHFVDHNRCWPSKIFIYRDGVGDGQLDICSNYEAVQMEEVLMTAHNVPAERPLLTYIVVQKRINTRIFALSNGRDYSNPGPGSIVDNTITRRDWYDFFLVSQHVTQGTVSPTHYVVVLDRSNIKPDNLQRLSYLLCHMYFNWPGTVRVPAPCQYAHKLAYLIGCSVGKSHHESLSDKLFFL